jgi:xylogalacturonan beta-1,3-xylosyltransferase
VCVLFGQKKTRFDGIEAGLARARAAIYEAVRSHNSSSYKEGSYIPRGAMYRNHYAFHQLSCNILFFSDIN